MKSLLSLVLFSGLLLVCYAAVFLQRQPAVPGHEKACHDRIDDVFYEKGERMKWRMKECGLKTCRGPIGNGYTYAEIQTCGIFHTPPECRVEVNHNLAYPHCCGRLICSESLANADDTHSLH